jgi:hypothetical protein
MTGKTGMTSNRSVTTKKYALLFSQQKKDLNEEQKKTVSQADLRASLVRVIVLGFLMRESSKWGDNNLERKLLLVLVVILSYMSDAKHVCIV